MGWVETWIERMVAHFDVPMRMDDGPRGAPRAMMGEREMLHRRYGR
jgi:hypothetical protein